MNKKIGGMKFLKKSMPIINRAFVIILGFSSFHGFADSPAREPFDYQVCSSKKNYCASVSAAGVIEISKVGSKKGVQLTIVGGWYPQAFLSNDGRNLVTIGTTIVPNQDFDQPIVKIFLDGKLKRNFLVKELVGNNKMGQTAGGFHWGDAVGFDADELAFVFKLEGGQVLSFPIAK